MASVGDTEVFIPEQASVVTVPVGSLPSSITRKMSMCLVHSERPAAFISPVELREKGTTQRPRALSPGQVLLPVVTSNRKAFRILREFLHAGVSSLRFSDETSPAGSSFSRRSHSIVLFDQQIFLVVTKSKTCDLSREIRNPAPSECEAPPPKSPVTTGRGSDLTDGRNNKGTCGAEDDGKCAEKRCGDGAIEEDNDITDRIRSDDGAGAAEDHGKCIETSEEREETVPLRKDLSAETAKQMTMEEKKDDPAEEEQDGVNEEAKLSAQTGSQTGNEQNSSFHLETGVRKDQRSSVKASCRKRISFSAAAASASDVTDQRDESEVRGQIGESDRTKTSGEVTDAEVLQVADDDADDSKSTAGDQSESDVEIVDVTDGDGNAGVPTSASKVEDLLEKCRNLKRIINDFVQSPLRSPLILPQLEPDLIASAGARRETPIRDPAERAIKVETKSERKSQLQNPERDVEIIEVDDDDDDDDDDVEEIRINTNNVNIPEFGIPAEGNAGKASDTREIPDARESRRDGAEHPSEKTESRKRRVSGDGDHHAGTPTIKTEDPSPKRLKPAAAEDPTSCGNSEEPSQSVVPGDAASPESLSELRISQVVSLSAPRELPESRASDPEPSDHDEEVALRPASPETSQELDYVVLKREENINRIRARLRGMEKKLDTLKC